jgi:hypothetical protein
VEVGFEAMAFVINVIEPEPENFFVSGAGRSNAVTCPTSCKEV